MKDKPHLSAEMEKRLKKLFYKEYLIKSDPEDYIHEGLDSSQQYSHLKAFLATALEEQKKEVTADLLKHMRKVMFEWHGTGWAMVDDYEERFLNRKE